ncbi:MAG: hypothetical protein HC862_19865 [Scytonema sp. RU_4_4]|nr:hypothetical protein [Scytonema sp. RU_4_4]NJR74590.1 hypothetical protein [Scytonema sp. CRU_2_7]
MAIRSVNCSLLPQATLGEAAKERLYLYSRTLLGRETVSGKVFVQIWDAPVYPNLDQREGRLLPIPRFSFTKMQ